MTIGEREAVRLVGDGLILREWRDADVPLMTALFDDPAIAFRTPLPSPFDLAAAQAYLERARRTAEIGERVQLAITRDGEEPLGEVLLSRSYRSLGYAIGPAHRGQGLASRALRLLTEYAHRDAGISRVVLEIEPDNEASAGVAKAAGYVLTDMPPSLVSDKGRSYTLLTWEHRR
ncbi:GNAT family N-acetyltransferase [Kribbella deserti]|uniref:GNAT family N-acetyltransferase n=1 Tax=Kribbella deserti TaxID=1926257 RepID=A0ABV6QPP0_9ACTN